MRKNAHTISINIISALIIVLCLFMGAINPTNAWFTSASKNGVQIQLEIGDLKLKVFQNDATVETNEILTNDQNNEYETDKNPDETPNTDTQPSYVDITGKIIPGKPVDLVLILANTDQASASMYVRFKFEVFIRGISADTKIENVALTGCTAPAGENGGFVEDGDYFYYRNTSGSNILFAKGTVATMLQKFTIPDSVFVDNSGNMLITNSQTLYIKLTVEGSTSNTFAV